MFFFLFIMLTPAERFAKTLWHFLKPGDSQLPRLSILNSSYMLNFSKVLIKVFCRNKSLWAVFVFFFLKFCPLVWTSEILDCWSSVKKVGAKSCIRWHHVSLNFQQNSKSYWSSKVCYSTCVKYLQDWYIVTNM